MDVTQYIPHRLNSIYDLQTCAIDRLAIQRTELRKSMVVKAISKSDLENWRISEMGVMACFGGSDDL